MEIKRGKIVRVIRHPEKPYDEIILQCPYCGNEGTARECRDFTLLSFGKYLCRKCGREFTLFGKDIRENLEIAFTLMDKYQRQAAETLMKEPIKKKRGKRKT
jgi:DNA-directed RNA polymerase subunit RPC12/RpoP